MGEVVAVAGAVPHGDRADGLTARERIETGMDAQSASA